MAHPPLPPSRPLPWYQPPATSGRSLAPDLARGFMLLLIAWANSSWHLWGHPLSMSLHPGDGSALDRVLRAVLAVAVEGRIYPMFAFLLGYGMVQFARARAGRGVHPIEVRRQLRRRHWFLVLFGFVHALLLFSGDVLGAYGLLGLVLVGIFFNRSDKVILGWGIAFTVLMVLGGVAGTASGFVLDAAMSADPEVARQIQESLTETGGFDPSGSGEHNIVLAMLFRAGMWLITAPASMLMLTLPASILFGWWAARRGVLEQPDAHRRLLTWVAVVGIGLGWASGVPAALHHLGVLGLPEHLAWAPLSLAYAFGGLAGIGYAALFGLVAARRPRPGRLGLALTAVGRRSLSAYLWQSIVMAPLLAAWGLGLGQHVNTAGVLAIATLTWLAGLGLCVWLDRRQRPGPFEALLRRLVNGGRPAVPKGGQ
ncbi:MAG: DUF418 domain-containing protein [Propionibacteriaceae bacterium]|nr:DUF418 domain-containing protein [Propionibacteriaceae bacterium]